MDGLQRAAAMSKILPLWRINAASPDYTRVFGITGLKGDSRRLNLKNVIRHDKLGDASLRRVNALDGVST